MILVWIFVTEEEMTFPGEEYEITLQLFSEELFHFNLMRQWSNASLYITLNISILKKLSANVANNAYGTCSKIL